MGPDHQPSGYYVSELWECFCYTNYISGLPTLCACHETKEDLVVSADLICAILQLFLGCSARLAVTWG